MTTYRHRGLVGLVVCLVFVLSGCQSTVKLEIFQNDTYNFNVDFSFPREKRPTYSCDEFRRILGQTSDTSQLRIGDKSTKDRIACTLAFAQPQPISLTKAPFATISRKGDVFRLQLAPIDDLKMLANDDIDFTLMVVFPGPVLGASGGKAAIIKGNTVTWKTPSVLYKGFTAEGKAYSGPPIWLRGVYMTLIAMITMTLLMYLLRRTHTMRNIRTWAGQYDDAVGSPLKRSLHRLHNTYYAVIDYFYVLFTMRKH
ncbi:MAG: hypothetical protein Q4P66_08475 [Actinomycetaceae bacterium]|nr:hypothetical protein [Actinomycetaceae bacterium]